MKKKDIAKILLAGAVLAVLFLARDSRASGSGFSLIFIPSNPEPGAKVTARIETYDFDADRAFFTWEMDGAVLTKGTGEKSVSITSPELGKQKNIVVSVVTADSTSAKRTFPIIGQDVDMFWEAGTYVPFWYKGKALPVEESPIKIMAMPHLFSKGVEIKRTNLVYEWYVNFEKDLNKSGTGKNSFVFNPPIYDSEYTISVKVSSLDGGIIFEKGTSFDLAANSPKIIFYESRPIEGVFSNNALNNETQLSSSEISVKAEPFFFSKRNLKNLKYEWTMNGETISSDTEPGIITLRTEGGSGAANIGLRISNPISILQFAEKFLQINYGQ